MVVVEPVVHGICINPEGERATVNQILVLLRPVGYGIKRLIHDADLRGDGDQITILSISST